MKRAVVLLSGGLDSATCLAMAKAQGFAPVCLAVAYGQRHAVELERARELAQGLGADAFRRVQVDLRAVGGSALTDDQLEVPKGRSAEEQAQLEKQRADNEAERVRLEAEVAEDRREAAIEADRENTEERAQEVEHEEKQRAREEAASEKSEADQLESEADRIEREANAVDPRSSS